MLSSRLIRLSGLAALVGFAVTGAIDAAFPFVFPESAALSVLAVSDTWFVLHVFYIIALLIGLLGLLGVYARQAEKAGVLGLIGVLMAYFGFALLFALEWTYTFVAPGLAHAVPQFLDHPDPHLTALDTEQTISLLLALVGLTLFAVASLRAAVLPRGAAVLVLVGVVFGLVVNLVGVEIPIVLSLASAMGTLGIVWMGYAVWSRPAVGVESTTPMTASGPSLANR